MMVKTKREMHAPSFPIVMLLHHMFYSKNGEKIMNPPPDCVQKGKPLYFLLSKRI